MSTTTITMLPLHLAGSRMCPACEGNGAVGLDADQDGDYGYRCRACHATGSASYCASCALAGADDSSEFDAAYELRALDATGHEHWRRPCFRAECLGEAVQALHEAVLASATPGLVSTRPASAAQEHAS